MTAERKEARAGADHRQAIREMWRVDFSRGALEDAERLAESFAGAWGAGETSPDERLQAAIRDLSYARSYARWIENQEMESDLRRSECFFILVAGRIATELRSLLPEERLPCGPWREDGLREVFLPTLGADDRSTLSRAIELFHDRSLERRVSESRRARRAGEELSRPSFIGRSLEALGLELRFLSEYLRSLLQPDAARLSIEVERLATSAMRGAKERCDG